jgi:hypothetical protein
MGCVVLPATPAPAPSLLLQCLTGGGGAAAGAASPAGGGASAAVRRRWSWFV